MSLYFKKIAEVDEIGSRWYPGISRAMIDLVLTGMKSQYNTYLYKGKWTLTYDKVMGIMEFPSAEALSAWEQEYATL